MAKEPAVAIKRSGTRYKSKKNARPLNNQQRITSKSSTSASGGTTPATAGNAPGRSSQYPLKYSAPTSPSKPSARTCCTPGHGRVLQGDVESGAIGPQHVRALRVLGAWSGPLAAALEGTVLARRVRPRGD